MSERAKGSISPGANDAWAKVKNTKQWAPQRVKQKVSKHLKVSTYNGRTLV